MSKLTGDVFEAAVDVVAAGQNAFMDKCYDLGLAREDLPEGWEEAVTAMLVGAVKKALEPYGKEPEPHQEPEPLEEPPLDQSEVEYLRATYRQQLLARVANLKSTNKAERGLPGEISHDQGWQGALELMEEAIQEVLK